VLEAGVDSQTMKIMKERSQNIAGIKMAYNVDHPLLGYVTYDI
jgi:hypothetical protein